MDRLVVGKVTAAGLLSTSNRGIAMVESSIISRSTIDVSTSRIVMKAERIAADCHPPFSL